MAKENLIVKADIEVNPREIDFVTRFENSWEHLREILGIMRPIKKQPGAVLKSKYAEGTLQSGKVGEGEEIPYSKFTVKEKTYAEMDIENDYFFIIDEINRGNLSKIFDELFMLIESDKRGVSLQLLYSDEKFSVPSNVPHPKQKEVSK